MQYVRGKGHQCWGVGGKVRSAESENVREQR